MRGLSQEQAQVLAFMQGRVPHTRWTRSDHESMADHGVTVRAAYQHVRALQRQEAPSSARHHCSIRLSPEHVPPVGLPIIGHVVTSAPILAAENLDRYPEIYRL